MRLCTAAQMRELDRRTMEEGGVSGEELMDRAGRGVADVIAYISDLAGFHHPSALLIAGRGNNGGDAFAAARYLKDMGIEVIVWIAGAESQIGGDALKHLHQLKAEGVSPEEYATREEWEDNAAYPIPVDFIVDGLLGTGSRGPARGPVAWAIQYINTAANDAFVVSIDIPSGLNADTGVAEGDCVCADVTATIGAPKTGLVEPAALEFVGGLEVLDIGLISDPPAPGAKAPERELIYSTELRKMLPRRARASHKGMYGHTLLLGGAVGYAGAIAMAARAAAHSGAGLCSALVPRSIYPIVAGASLTTMVYPGAETAEGSLAFSAVESWPLRGKEISAIVLGPGLTRHPDSRRIVEWALERSDAPIVLDADALNVLDGDLRRLAKSRSALILTPHPGEMGRLLGRDAAEVQADRIGAARTCAERSGATVVLKGAGTIVTARQRPAFINMTGNPGMASGGSGDALAGLLGGLLSQGLAPFDAARAGVFLHGRAGDMAAWRSSQSGLTAMDLIREIPFAFREMTLR